MMVLAAAFVSLFTGKKLALKYNNAKLYKLAF